MSRVADPNVKIALLRAAEEVFAERGLSRAKVEEIARRARVSKGAFYLHFKSKEEALKQLVESFLARCQSFFAPPSAYDDLPTEPRELLDFTVRRDVQIYDFLWQNRAFLRILPTCQGEHDYLLMAFRAEVAQTTRQWVDYYRKNGIFRQEVDADLAATLIGGGYNELSLRLIHQEGKADRRPRYEEWLEFTVDTFFRAFGTQTMLLALAAGSRRNRPVSFDIDRADGRRRRARRTRTGPAAQPRRAT